MFGFFSFLTFFVLLGFVHFLSFCFTRQRKKKENEPKERKTRLWVLHLLRAQGFGFSVWVRRLGVLIFLFLLGAGVYSCSDASHLILRYPEEPLPPCPCSKESFVTPPPPPPLPPNSLFAGSWFLALFAFMFPDVHT